MAKIKPRRGQFNTSKVAAVLHARGMKPGAAKNRAKALQLKSHRKLKKHMAGQQKAAVASAKEATARRAATIGKTLYATSLYNRFVAGPAGRLASYGRNFRGRS